MEDSTVTTSFIKFYSFLPELLVHILSYVALLEDLQITSTL